MNGFTGQKRQFSVYNSVLQRRTPNSLQWISLGRLTKTWSGTYDESNEASIAVTGNGVSSMELAAVVAPASATAPPHRDQLLPALTSTYRTLLSLVGEDPTRQGLLKTPERAAKAMLFFTAGYEKSVEGEYALTLHPLMAGLLQQVGAKWERSEPIPLNASQVVSNIFYTWIAKFVVVRND